MSKYSEDPFASKNSFEAAYDTTDILKGLDEAFKNKPMPDHNWVEELANTPGILSIRSCHVNIDNFTYALTRVIHDIGESFSPLGTELIKFSGDNKDVSKIPVEVLMAPVRIAGEVSDTEAAVRYRIYESESKDVLIVTERLKSLKEELMDTPDEILEQVIEASHIVNSDLDAIDAEAAALQVYMTTIHLHPLEIASKSDLDIVNNILKRAATSHCTCHAD